MSKRNLFNEVLDQLLIALCVCLAPVDVYKFKTKVGLSLTAILSLLQLNLFVRRYLDELLMPTDNKQPVVSQQL